MFQVTKDCVLVCCLLSPLYETVSVDVPALFLDVRANNSPNFSLRWLPQSAKSRRCDHKNQLAGVAN